MNIFNKCYAVILGLVGATFLLPGIYLVILDGTAYYFFAGALLLTGAVSLFLQKPNATWLIASTVVLTICWALYENGFDFWAMSVRLYFVAVLGLVLFVSGLIDGRRSPSKRPGMLVLGLSLVLAVGVTVASYNEFLQGLSIDPSEFFARDRQSANNVTSATNWPAYGGTSKGTKFSSASEINRDNVVDLEVAWQFRTGVGHSFKNTPLQVGNSLYACGGGNIILALDAETGDELWRFDAEIDKKSFEGFMTYYTTSCRGVSFYEPPGGYAGQCPRRILMGTTDARLMAVDADTGQLCTSFGNEGQIDLTKNLGEVKENFYMVTSAPAIVSGNAVLGGWVFDNLEIKEPSGVIRAFDAITGEFSWAWDMGRPGVHTEPVDGEIYTRGTPNMWSLFSVDNERGIVYAPLGNETPDYFGAQRHEASEKYASAVVALNGANGGLIWSFQTVHHDLWDYDLPSQPTLVDIPDSTGTLIPALVQATKRGEVFLLNRETGEPIAVVEERAVPQGGVPDDFTAPTQPFSALPNVLAEPITEQNMWGVTPYDQMWCRAEFLKLRYEGHFTPPSTEPGFQFPGNVGGYNWGGVSVHEGQHIMVGNMMTTGNRTQLVPREEIANHQWVSPQSGTPYGISSMTFASPFMRFGSPRRIPCTPPPFGMLVAIDLQSHDLLWKRSIGTGDKLAGLPLEVGVPNLGGSITTAGELIFFGGTMDGFIRALDIHSGKELWRHPLPATAHATPMTYVSPESGRQTVIMTVPEKERGDPGDGKGGYIIAFRLPTP